MEMYRGRPESLAGRSLPELRSYSLLDELKIEYYCTEHPAADNMEICQQRAKVLGTRICKNLFLCNRQETAFYLLAMPADKQFKTSLVSKQLGVSRLHFASAEFMERFLDLQPGSVSIMGLMNDKENKVQLLIDRDILEQEFFACHPCINTSSIKFKTRELMDALLPAIHHSPRLLEL